MATDNDIPARFGSTPTNNVKTTTPPPSTSSSTTLKIALVIGITGQDGSYFTEFLLNKGYEVHGLICRSSNFNTQQINHLYINPHNAHKARMKLHYAYLIEASSLHCWLDTINPDKVYNLVA